MASDVDAYIRDNCPWAKLPKNTRQLLGNSAKEYDKLIVEYSVKNQLRYKGNLVRNVKKNEEQYYELLMQYSRQHLMLYPYHLSDVIVKGLRTTPFQYYMNMMQDLMTMEKSYDSLPNFTAADCLRLLGIGRNQYIDLMNQCRSMKKTSFRKKPIRDILPQKPVEINIQPWWLVQIGHILEDDVRVCTKEEKEIIDLIVDEGAQEAGRLDMVSLKRLYARGLVYLDVPVHDEDSIIVPPLDGFVMNRVLGDYFETILYKIFVSIGENTSVAELAKLLDIDLQLVKNAVSLFCRLGFAYKKSDANAGDAQPTWNRKAEQGPFIVEGELPARLDLHNSVDTPCNEGSSLIDFEDEPMVTSGDDALADTKSISESSMINTGGKRFGFLFDSALTAFLMMGNLSNSLKSHAVTLFEVGKLNDEALDSFIEELNKVQSFSEGGEAQRYFEHAQVLKDTIKYLRDHSDLDLIRCESLMGLDPLARLRLLKKNYQLLISMAPLSNEVSPLNCSEPAHLGPSVVEVNSAWFRLFLYNLIGQGPVSLLIVKGTRVRKLPKALKPYRRLLLCTWGHDPGIVSADSCLIALNDSLQHSAVFIQGYSLVAGDAEVVHVPFPLSAKEAEVPGDEGPLYSHPAVLQLSNKIGLRHSCGYVTLMRSQVASSSSLASIQNGGSAASLALGDAQQPIFGFGASISRDPRKVSSSRAVDEKQRYSEWTLYDCVFGLPLFDQNLNKMICERLNEHQLLTGGSLNEIRDCSTALSTMVLDFIKDFQPFASEKEHYGSSDERRVPYPLHSLIFENGAVRIWDGV